KSEIVIGALVLGALRDCRREAEQTHDDGSDNQTGVILTHYKPSAFSDQLSAYNFLLWLNGFKVGPLPRVRMDVPGGRVWVEPATAAAPGSAPAFFHVCRARSFLAMRDCRFLPWSGQPCRSYIPALKRLSDAPAALPFSLP